MLNGFKPWRHTPHLHCGVENCDDLIVIVEMEEEKLTKGKGNWKNSHEAIDDATFNNQWKKIFAAI